MNYLSTVFSIAQKESKALYIGTLASFAFILPAVVGLAIDDRILLGVNVWLKPFKFAISQGIYLLSIGVLFKLYPYSARKKKVFGHIISWTMMIELLIIFYQGSRGVQSHYNLSSPLDGLLYAIMGIFVSINVVLMMVLLIDAMRLKLKCEKPMQWAIVMAWLVVIIGCAVGGQMIGQLGHNVGIVDGGAGLPLTNWSTVAGDLRIAHFFGLHGLQIIPIFAFFVSKKLNVSMKKETTLVTAFAILYAAWIGFTYYQASLGIPLIGMNATDAIS